MIGIFTAAIFIGTCLVVVSPESTPFTFDCKLTPAGVEYKGDLSTTATGRTCQRWDSRTPHYSYYRNSKAFSDGNATLAGNNCRNPNKFWRKGPWCYTMDKTKRWDLCNITFCECKLSQSGVDYQGKVSVTSSGKSCQSWRSQSPSSHPYKSGRYFPDGLVSRASNNCRNPNNSRSDGPWCYTTSGSPAWEYCSIPTCESKGVSIETRPPQSPTPSRPTTTPTTRITTQQTYLHSHIGCKITRGGFEYAGKQPKTRGGYTCQRWDSLKPHHNYFVNSKNFPDGNSTLAGNNCRNPTTNWHHGPWCYTSSRSKRWDLCNIPFCECRGTEDGSDYEGLLKTTVSGKTCQRWSQQTPHKHKYTNSSFFPDHLLSYASNYCRNPNSSRSAVWCYTTDSSTEWEYCRVPKCNFTLPSSDSIDSTTVGIFTTEDDKNNTDISATQDDSITTESPEILTTSCKLTRGGHEYAGTLSTTSGGFTCQRWDQHGPHYNYHIKSMHFPDYNSTAAENYCRNPTPYWHHGPWCYTTNRRKRWDTCDIKFCECKVVKSGERYEGLLAETKSGKSCQEWSTQSPNQHPFINATYFPDRGGMSVISNRCRNPNGTRADGPWCYTVDTAVPWEYCDVKDCDVSQLVSTQFPTTTPTTLASTTHVYQTWKTHNCKITPGGHEYAGTKSTTKSGYTCQRWDSRKYHYHYYTTSKNFPEGNATGASNYCRNPASFYHGGPWCFTTDKTKRWETCDIDFCECRATKTGTIYQGKKTRTIGGKTCQSWSSQSPHNHPYGNKTYFPDTSLGVAGNKCRNPGGRRKGVWCYTTDTDTVWDYCNVPMCNYSSEIPYTTITTQITTVTEQPSTTVMSVGTSAATVKKHSASSLATSGTTSRGSGKPSSTQPLSSSTTVAESSTISTTSSSSTSTTSTTVTTTTTASTTVTTSTTTPKTTTTTRTTKKKQTTPRSTATWLPRQTWPVTMKPTVPFNVTSGADSQKNSHKTAKVVVSSIVIILIIVGIAAVLFKFRGAFSFFIPASGKEEKATSPNAGFDNPTYMTREDVQDLDIPDPLPYPSQSDA